jgi:hypothetical protein
VFADSDACDIVISRGRKSAFEALAVTRQRAMPGILCILDLDYFDSAGQASAGANIIH